MSIGVPYRDALEMPIDMAIALLSVDERPNNTRPAPSPVSPVIPELKPAPVSVASTGKRFIASRRRFPRTP